MDFKSYIAEAISKATNINKDEIESYVEIPKDETNGDFAFPCFRLAKELKQSPVNIANNIKDNIKVDSNIISKIDVVNGFLNFYVAKECLAKETIQKFDTQKEDYGKSNIGEGKTVIVEYSSPNIAKPFHIGHLKTTIIGNSLYKLYKYLGFNTIGINHLGDYGTQFAKLIEGYKRWGSEYDFSTDAIDKLADIYKRINALCEDDEKVLEECRETFKKLEDGDPYCTDLWNKFKDLSVKEFDEIYDLLGVKFDSTKGEAFYSDKMQEIIDILEKSGKLVESQGAKVVDLEDVGINTPCIIQKANGSSIYATRDLAAIMYRARTYDFDKCIYVVAYEQNLHFKQVFEVAKFLDLDEKYTNGLIHVPYGMVRLKTGKMSTREGTLIKLEDILKEAVTRAKAIIEEKNPNIEGKDDIAKKVGIGAVIFNDLSNNIIKDEVFDWDIMLNFQGETGPYIQYMYVRTKSILEKENYVMNKDLVDISELEEHGIELIKQIYSFNDIVKQAVDKNEPSIISRYLIDVAKLYSSFYNDNKIIVEDEKIKNTRLCLTYMVGNVLKIGTGLLGMEMPDRM